MKNYVPELKYETVVHKEIVRRRIVPPGMMELPFDEPSFNLTEIGRRRREFVALFDSYADKPLHPDLLRYWANKGLKKELFDADHDDAKYAYSVFTPLDIDPEKKYALIYYSHGGGHNIEMAEIYGFNELAAIEKYIIVYPQNGGRSNDEVDTEFGRIMGELKKKGYPIDWERVYTAGFSSGSDAAISAACTYPDMVAAVSAMTGGNVFTQKRFYTGPEYYASTKGLRIPCFFCGGTVDRSNFPAPWILDHEGILGSPGDHGVPKMEYAVENLNIWLREIGKIKNYTPLTLDGIKDLLRNSDDPVEKESGLIFDKTFSFTAQGTNWIGGDYYGDDGAPAVRYVRAYGIPHVIWESEANVVWDYLKHFRRDLNTGESIYDPVVCWGER
ncbi:MAG: hypothetical protein LBQ95_06405 [Lachnospiraceae bacterium]|jgi:hypothetical protein|nr:hypothetical protein [Lachnospiraceae bacterium]